ncbi:hypothetical protein ACB092_01G027300 [Castanea dentata]
MAEIANGVAGKVLEQLGSLLLQEIISAWGVQNDLKKLEITVTAIKAVLLDAEEKQASDHRLKHWLGQLKVVLNDADNVLDEFQYRILQKEVMKICSSRSTFKKVRCFFSGSNPIVFRFKMARKIKDIRKSVDDIAADREKFNLSQRLEDRETTMPMRDTHSFVNPPAVFGREDDKENIIRLLMQEDAGRNVTVIPIVGFGGLGKTTLAKLVYNDDWVVEHFQLRMWVCVSNDFNVTRLIKEILISAEGIIKETSSVDQLQIQLRNRLARKKFLLVLDDVWNEDRNKWIELEELLIHGFKGSKIMVTTRNGSVAAIMGNAPTYNLKVLSPNDCFSLFVTLAFREGEKEWYSNLLEIGREIVIKCKGVPLAVKTLASLLYSKVNQRDWEFVRDNQMLDLEQKDDDILPVLRLSYNQLPFHLKQCFAYCSLFPKAYKFKSAELIQFWMAHGILQAHGNQELEDVGNSYIKELWSRSFFQDVEEKIFSFYTFEMHDLLHDLALLVMQGEFSVMTKNSVIDEKVCHLSFLECDQEVCMHLKKLSKMRTIIFQIQPPMSFVEACISRFKYLRVLNLCNSTFEVLSSSIGTLKHLRFLDLSLNDQIRELPNSICKMHNLQTLRLLNCNKLKQLPVGLSNMISLRHLLVKTNHTCLLENGVGLKSVQFLCISRCPRLKCLFEEMEGHLTNLRTLIFYECKSLSSLSLILKHLPALENLMIADCGENCLREGEDNQDLNSLKALPEWLPSLKSLQRLWIVECPLLSSLPEGMQGLNALKELRIEGCARLIRNCRQEDQPKIAHIPHIHLNESTDHQQEAGCARLIRNCRQEDQPKIAHIPHIHLNESTDHQQEADEQEADEQEADYEAVRTSLLERIRVATLVNLAAKDFIAHSNFNPDYRF